MPSRALICIVSYRAPAALATCLRAVERHAADASVVVWDNSSEFSDDAIRALSRAHPGVTWHFSATNVGFAAAVNAAVRTSAGAEEYLLLLNPDAELLGPLDPMLAALDADPTLAAAGPLFRDPRARPWDSAHRVPTVLRSIVGHAGYARRLRATPASDLYPSLAAVRDIGYLTGACLLIRRAAWQSVGEFDPRFFLYSEEVDWCTRARAAGLGLALVPTELVAHAAQGTVRDSAAETGRSEALLRRSTVLYLRKWHGRTGSAAYRGSVAVLDRVQRSKRRRAAEVGRG